jgi:hypothetical protein
MVAVAEIRRGVSPEEFLYVVKVLRRRKVAVEVPRAAPVDVAEQTVEVRLRLVKPAFETPRSRSYQLDLFLPQIAKIDLRLRPLAPSFEEPRQSSLQLEYGVPPVKSLAASLKPITIPFKEVPQIWLNLSFEPPRIAPLRLKLAEISPSFGRPWEVSVSVDFSAPSLATASPQPSPPDAPEAPLEELEEVYSEPLLRLGGVISERPVVIVARPTGFGYIEFLKRVLREIYRVRSEGLPEPKHVSTLEDLRLLLPVDVGAGKRLFVLDLSRSHAQEPKAEDLLKEKSRDLDRLRDRLRELFSQEFGFFVIYGDVKKLSIWERALAEAVRGYASVVPSPVEVSIRPGRLPFYVLLANAMWGRISDPVLDYERLGFRGFDEFVVWLEDEYWRRLGEVSFEVLYKTKPSAGERESELHYLTKAFVVRHLAERVDPNCRVETEKGVGAAVFDVVVTCGGLQGLVVEVETLYGTGTVVHKLVETVERAGGETVERAGKRKMWIVVPNPQAVIYLPLLLRTRRELRKEHDVEFYTLDVTSRGLVRLTDVASMLVKKWKETTEGAEEANTSLTAD